MLSPPTSYETKSLPHPNLWLRIAATAEVDGDVSTSLDPKVSTQNFLLVCVFFENVFFRSFL
jgi:hypothetical protein